MTVAVCDRRGNPKSEPVEAVAAILDEAALRRIGRLTWRFFEDFVGPDTNHLPPDNFQETPAPKLAERTSPTNIGLYLLSVMSARDLGWIGVETALKRIDATLATMERMARFRGHYFNWYDTRTLTVLPQPYISSVDSGNLAGALVALASGLRGWASEAAAIRQPRTRGIADTLGVPVLGRHSALGDATTVALWEAACEKAGVPVQRFVGNNDVPCGSTIGPITATRLGIDTVDVGVPMLSMHSARELVGATDQAMYGAALAAFLAPGRD